VTVVLDNFLVITLIILNVILGIGLIWINWRIYLVTEYIARSTNLLYKVIEEFMSVKREE